MKSDFYDTAKSMFDYTRALRRDFHLHPELGFQEIRTASIVTRELNELGMEVSTGIAKTGVVGLLEGSGPGPVVLLRFDMDALPIQEETGAEYASQNPGVMHACGHDGHTAIGLTVARMLNNVRDQFKGTVKFVFQPAEEGLGGAKQMVAEGVLENPRPEVSLACHLWNDKPLGWIGVTNGPAMAGAEVFSIRITGSGGHGASPHLTRDPVVTAAQVIIALQNIVSRNIPPLESAVVSVTKVNGGDTFNVIPSMVVLEGTFRIYQDGIQRKVIERLEQIVHGICNAMECQAEISYRGGTPAVINNLEIAAQVQTLAREMFPADVLETEHRTMGSEDCALLMRDIPGCYFFVGSARPDMGLDAPHHHPKFDFDETALSKAAGLMAASAVHFLNK